LADPDAIRVAILTPRQRPGVAVEPGEKPSLGGSRERGWQGVGRQKTGTRGQCQKEKGRRPVRVCGQVGKSVACLLSPDHVLGRRMYLERISAAALELSAFSFFSGFLGSPGFAPRAGISMTGVGWELICSTVGAVPADPSSSPKSRAAAWSGSSSSPLPGASTTVVTEDRSAFAA